MFSLVDGLSEAQKDFYKKAAAALKNFEKKIPLASEISMEDTEEVWKTLELMESDMFYVNFQKMQISSTLRNDAVLVEYLFSKEEAMEKLRQLEEKKKQICGNFDGSSAVEATEYIHDYLAETVRYDYAAARRRVFGSASTIVGALLDETAVCSGISKAARFLLDGLDVESLIISGRGMKADSEISDTNSAHSWNLNLLPSGNYHMDITWDMKECSPLAQILHNYCNVDEDTAVLNHDWDFLRYPRALVQADNYYMRRGQLFNNRLPMERYLEKCLSKRQEAITFRVDARAGFPDDNGKTVINSILKIGTKCTGTAIQVNYTFDYDVLVFNVLVKYQ